MHPIFSKFSFNSSASDLFICFLITTGAFSTVSLASFKPRPRSERTSLIILIFVDASKAVNSTSKLCFATSSFFSSTLSAYYSPEPDAY